MKERIRKPGARRLNAMIAEALVDAYGEDEAASAWCTTLEEQLSVPFISRVLGFEVTVARVKQKGRSGSRPIAAGFAPDRWTAAQSVVIPRSPDSRRIAASSNNVVTRRFLSKGEPTGRVSSSYGASPIALR